jgi:hypothetical protein
VGNFFDVNQQRDDRDLFLGGVPSVDAPLEQHGTASVTYLFSAGQSAPLGLFTVIQATVPEPQMLLPTILGLICIAAYAESRAKLMRTKFESEAPRCPTASSPPDNIPKLGGV